MKELILEKDIVVYYIQAKSFPDGILDAFQQMNLLIESAPQRRSFGISRCENGEIIYRVASEELINGDLEKYGLTKLIIQQGKYIGIEVKNFRKDLSSIKKAIDKLFTHPNIDPNGYCIEEYYGIDDVLCMVRLKDEE